MYRIAGYALCMTMPGFTYLKLLRIGLWKIKITLATQPPYSTDVNLQDCFIFRRGRPLHNKDAVLNIVKEYLTTLKPTDFSTAFVKLGQHLQSGDYL